MAQIGSTWGPDTWVALGGWAANTWGPAEPPVIDVTDVCLTATRTSLVYLSASTDHGRQCGDDPVACAALTQAVQTPAGGVQVWEFTLPSAQVPVGGIDSWTIDVRFASSANGPADLIESATVTEGGTPDVTDATFTITLDADDLTGFSSNSMWYWTAWRTDTGEEEVLAGNRLLGMPAVQVL